ncbi:hypothetical protein J1614_005174 [Plenodomus biglobosus]|nr:hypothetical protein J1614_005174 [Plenodomus biglobosus]
MASEPIWSHRRSEELRSRHWVPVTPSAVLYIVATLALNRRYNSATIQLYNHLTRSKPSFFGTYHSENEPAMANEVEEFPAFTCPSAKDLEESMSKTIVHFKIQIHQPPPTELKYLGPCLLSSEDCAFAYQELLALCSEHPEVKPELKSIVTELGHCFPKEDTTITTQDGAPLFTFKAIFQEQEEAALLIRTAEEATNHPNAAEGTHPDVEGRTHPILYVVALGGEQFRGKAEQEFTVFTDYTKAVTCLKNSVDAHDHFVQKNANLVFRAAHGSVAYHAENVKREMEYVGTMMQIRVEKYARIFEMKL